MDVLICRNVDTSMCFIHFSRETEKCRCYLLKIPMAISLKHLLDAVVDRRSCYAPTFKHLRRKKLYQLPIASWLNQANNKSFHNSNFTRLFIYSKLWRHWNTRTHNLRLFWDIFDFWDSIHECSECLRAPAGVGLYQLSCKNAGVKNRLSVFQMWRHHKSLAKFKYAWKKL